MANIQDLHRAGLGAAHWNSWAAQNAGASVDFSVGSIGIFDFQGFVFPGDANFSQCAFYKPALFNRAVFKGLVQIDRGIFHADAIFENAVFEQGAYMAHHHFLSYANFRCATFIGTCDLTNAHFGGETVFTGASFDDALFRGVEVEHRLVTFEDAKFMKVPDFRNSSFKTPPILSGIIVSDPKNKATPEGQDADKYRYLKLMASDAKDHQNELKFFAKELRAKRGHETKDRRAILLNRLYEWSSDFGQSVALPLYWLLGLVVASWLVRVGACLPASWNALEAHLAMSFADTFLLVGSEKWGLRTTAVPLAVCSRDFGLWQHVGALVQSITSVALVFLIGLGLRNRFKMGSSN